MYPKTLIVAVISFAFSHSPALTLSKDAAKNLNQGQICSTANSLAKIGKSLRIVCDHFSAREDWPFDREGHFIHINLKSLNSKQYSVMVRDNAPGRPGEDEGLVSRDYWYGLMNGHKNSEGECKKNGDLIISHGYDKKAVTISKHRVQIPSEEGELPKVHVQLIRQNRKGDRRGLFEFDCHVTSR